jgi:hypothetical protein
MLKQAQKLLDVAKWLPASAWQRYARRFHRCANRHVMIAVADHFEPSVTPQAPGGLAPLAEQLRRLDDWIRNYPAVMAPWRDADGYPLRHTYFYPAEQYHPEVIGRLAEHCHRGWGEIEIHLHHGVEAPDTPENTCDQLVRFRDALVQHGCLSRWEGAGPPQYAFVHGNWALANSANNCYCGVDNEMEILAHTGCYADFTLPSAPSRGQVAKINSLYECGLPLHERAPHRRGCDLRVGRSPRIRPLMVQGPLALRWGAGRYGLPRPKIENGEITRANPPTIERFHLWERMGIAVHGRPEWIFIKLHCHGMDPRDQDAMLGGLRRRFLEQLVALANADATLHLHFVTAREMVNIILAACDGCEGNPGQYRDYRLQLCSPASVAE